MPLSILRRLHRAWSVVGGAKKLSYMVSRGCMALTTIYCGQGICPQKGNFGVSTSTTSSLEIISRPFSPPVAACKNRGRRPGDSYHVIHGTGITCHHAYTYSHVEKMDLVFCTSYEDKTSADGEQHQAYKKNPSWKE